MSKDAIRRIESLTQALYLLQQENGELYDIINNIKAQVEGVGENDE